MTGQATWIRPLGDTGPPLDFTLRAEPGPGARVGLPRDLTGATSIVGTVRRWADGAIVQAAAATVIGSATSGAVRLPLTTTISTSPGLHGVTFTVVDPAEQRTYPSPMAPAWLLLAAPLGGASPVALPDPGAPVVIAPAGTGGPTVNGQLVLAGASATITAPAAVSWFQVAWSGVGTPWATGTTPTLVQAGSTVDAGAAAALLASGGNLAIVTTAASVLTVTALGRATIWAYNGSSYGPDPDARLIERATGDPAPTGVVANDIVLQQNP